MIRIIPTAVIALACAGCSTFATSPKATPTSMATSTASPKATPTSIGPVIPTNFKPSPQYRAFVHSMCSAFAARSAGTIQSDLMNYQYNTGVRYGALGDGEGQTADASVLPGWLSAPAHVRCNYYTPDIAGHGTLLTSGWTQSGSWSLIEMDTINGAWKINDFTFGTSSALYQAMQTTHPVLKYRV